MLPADAKLSAQYRPELLGGVTVITGTALLRDGSETASGEFKVSSVPFTAVPFYAWDNRAPGEMTVWIPETTESAQPAN
jgi:DUF1680 family protein